ncbi:MAG: SUF system NifU family Fe-S cluster assembly protein [Atopobiaceae bacterium]|nr:SUF system NifU family Fe-S cluster assembly protein [Atopobiaceae bacterium]
MAIVNIYSDVLMDHVANPDYNYELEDATHTHEGINPSCGDDLILHVKVGADGVIEKSSWTGHGCAISQASADMMSDLVIGKTVDEAREACALFGRMIRGEETDAELLEEELDEAYCLESISRMPARVKCAQLAWRTLDEMLAGEAAPGIATSTEDDATA